MYCTVADLQRILPEKVTIGNTNIGTPTPGATPTQRSNITPDQAKQYIQYAEQYIDGRLRQIYITPLRRIKTYETEVLSDLTHGSSVTVSVHDSGAFSSGSSISTTNLGGGDLVRLQDNNGMETATVSSIGNLTSVVVDAITNDYLVTANALISILRYPEPIPTITARLACSYILDRLFTAEQSPDVSQYGKTQRNLAVHSVDDILTGAITLMGQNHTGKRFVRGSLFDAYRTSAEMRKGEEKES